MERKGKGYASKACALVALVAMICSPEVRAEQTELELPQHDISLTAGALSSVELIDVLANVIVTFWTLGYVNVQNEEFSGAFTAQYLYRPKRWLAYGGSVTYERRTQDCMNKGTKVGEQKTSFVAVMPTVRFSWLNKRVVTMYSKVGAGMTFVSDHYKNLKDESNTAKVENEDSHFAAFQVTPVGIQVGTKVYGKAEVGFGNEGMFTIGIGYKF